jgi:hypothetical protein
MQLLKIVFLSLLFLGSNSYARDGGEIGNAFVAFESQLGGFRIEYPAEWNRSDLSQVVNFYDPKSGGPGKQSFLSVLTDQMAGIHTDADLSRHLHFFRPEVQWTKTSFAGLNGFRGEVDGVQVLYLLRAEENLLSVRYRANEGERSEKLVLHMLESFRLL